MLYNSRSHKLVCNGVHAITTINCYFNMYSLSFYLLFISSFVFPLLKLHTRKRKEMIRFCSFILTIESSLVGNDRGEGESDNIPRKHLLPRSSTGYTSRTWRFVRSKYPALPLWADPTFRSTFRSLQTNRRNRSWPSVQCFCSVKSID